MITVYGADWCEDTRRSRRHLRRLGVRHRYLNVDEDIDALARAKALNGEKRRTPTIDLEGEALVEPSNGALTETLVRRRILDAEIARERWQVQNVGDLERVLRLGAGCLTLLVAPTLPRAMRAPAIVLGLSLATSGAAGWCPAYAAAEVTSLGGPGDRPDEAERTRWVSAAR